MNRLAASLLAVALTAMAGNATAQSGYYGQSGQYGAYGQGNAYGQPQVDRYGQHSGAQYDYARVVRVDPVLQQDGYRSGPYGSQSYGQPYGNSRYGNSSHASRGYGGATAQRCYQQSNSYARGNDYYDRGNGYGSNGYSSYGNDGYRYSSYGNGGYGNSGYRSGGSEAGRTVATVIGGVLGAVVGSQVGGGSGRYATSAIGSMVGGIAGREVYEANQRNRYPQTGTVTVCDPVPAGNYGGAYGGNNGYYNAGDRGVSAYDVTYEYANRRYVTRTDYHPGDRIRVRIDVRPE